MVSILSNTEIDNRMPDRSSEKQELIRRSLSGDDVALGQLLDGCRGYLKTLAHRELDSRLGVRVDASDIVQQTFLLAHREFQQFRGEQIGELIAWLVKILARNVQQAVRRHVTTQSRSIGRERPIETGDGELSFLLTGREVSPSRRAMQGEDAIQLAECLMQLPHNQREAVRLRHLEGWPLQQIAMRLEATPAATAGYIKRGIHKLRELMKGKQ